MTRIVIPCKSRYCQHTSCFDLSTFFALNEQTPTWNCPICARSITTDDDLYMDGYFMDILEKTNKAVESVVIHPDGTWTNKDIDTDHPDAKFLNNANANNTNTNIKPTPSQEERKLSFANVKPEVVSLDDDDEEPSAPTPASLPPRSSREPSTSVRPSPSIGGGSGSSSRKRGPPQIVDLTLSDDDDNVLPPIRRPVSQQPSQQPPAKRVRVGFAGENPPQASSTPQTNGNSRRFSAILDRGVSHTPTSLTPPGPQPAQQAQQQSHQPSHIRSPPLSISPRNENPPNIFRPNHSPTVLDNTLSLARPLSISTTSPASTPTNIFSRMASFQSSPRNNVPQQLFHPTTRTEPQPSRHQAEPASSTLTRSSYPTPTTLTNNDGTRQLNNPRSRSASPVLPAFSNKPLNNSLRFVNWDNFWLNGTDDDFENPELDLEMARLPSSMFDADGRQDDSDY